VFQGYHRKVRSIFGLADMVSGPMVFPATHRIPGRLTAEHVFYLTLTIRIALSGRPVSVLGGTAFEREAYDGIDAAHIRVPNCRSKWNNRSGTTLFTNR